MEFLIWILSMRCLSQPIWLWRQARLGKDLLLHLSYSLFYVAGWCTMAREPSLAAWWSKSAEAVQAGWIEHASHLCAELCGFCLLPAPLLTLFPVCRGAGIPITWIQLCWQRERCQIWWETGSLFCDPRKWGCPKREVSREDKLCAPGLVRTGIRAWRSPPGSYSCC